MNSKFLTGIIVLLVILAGGYYLVRSSYPAVPTVPNPPSQSPIEVSPTPQNQVQGESAKAITVEGSEFAFSPSSFTLNQGDKITITFVNKGRLPHNLSIPELNLSTKTINPGESDSIQFTADKLGLFNFTCTVDSHADRGMTGTLTVR